MSNEVLDENTRQVSKLWTFLRELATAFWGDDVTRNNGLRSDVRKLEKRADTFEESMAEIKALLQDLATGKASDLERKKLLVTILVGTLPATITAAAAIIIALL